MKTLLILWLGPIVFFWSWYFLSLADLGFVFFSRALNDKVFALYGDILGIDPALIPMMVAKAIAVDSLFVLAFVLFRRRRQIAGWWKGRSVPADQARAAESLSSAP